MFVLVVTLQQILFYVLVFYSGMGMYIGENI